MSITTEKVSRTGQIGDLQDSGHEVLRPVDLPPATKVDALRGDDASWNPAQSPAELVKAVHDNLRNVGLDILDVVNLRVMEDVHAPSEGEGSIAPQFTALAEM